MINIGILSSSKGTSAQVVIDAIENKELDAKIAVIISDKKDAYVLERAKKHFIEAAFIDPKKFSNINDLSKKTEEYDKEIAKLLEEKHVDLVLCIGYMRIISRYLIQKFQGRILNIHPSLLPEFAGLADVNVHEEVLKQKKKKTGCTLHIVTEEIDGGPILLQKEVLIEKNDTAASLKERVQQGEQEILIKGIQQFIDKKIAIKNYKHPLHAMKIALISVYNKEGIVEFASELIEKGYRILSTGGTSLLLRKNGLEVTDISAFTGQEEILDGRVKTLHPKIFGGILGDLNNKEHVNQLKKYGMEPISLVCVNLYPFLNTIQKTQDIDEIIENIDIGGPSLIRAAAKNHASVLVITEPEDYAIVLKAVSNNTDDDKFRKHLATKAFAHTARYDVIINRFLFERFGDAIFPSTFNFSFEKVMELRYGENPHQQAALYKPYIVRQTGVPTAKQLQGKQLSYNNILDADEALNIVRDFDRPTAAVIKHNNPSGVASSDYIQDAYEKALNADPKSAFGSVVALNRPLNRETAELMKPNFIEVVICPKFEHDALEILKSKQNLRLLETGPIVSDYKNPEIRRIAAGLLAQTRQFPDLLINDLKVVTERKPTEQEIQDMIFAWKVNKHVKSNAVVFAKDECTVGIGAGQMSRVDAVNLVRLKPESHPQGSVMSSDAYFPFRDGLDQAVEAGATAIIQPGGSIRDEEVIKAANEHGIAMVFTGIRLFKH